jgi:FtsH-binding integral membrane protein
MGEKEMNKIMQTLLLTTFVILTTASFSYAEYAATGGGNFPYFHFGCLIVGGLIILSLKSRYPRLYLSEAIGSFALYTVLVALFTSPVVDALKTMVG